MLSIFTKLPDELTGRSLSGSASFEIERHDMPVISIPVQLLHDKARISDPCNIENDAIRDRVSPIPIQSQRLIHCGEFRSRHLVVIDTMFIQISVDVEDVH